MPNYRDREEPAPKPFGMVGVTKRAKLERVVAHDKFAHFCGFVEFEIEAVTPIQVATGLYELGESHSGGSKFPLYRDMTTVNGTVCIPGSSVKGCVRSLVEAVSPSCINKGASRVDDSLRPCFVRKNTPEVCVACSIFGAMGFLSRVRFSDAVLSEGSTEIVQIPALFGPRGKGRAYDPPSNSLSSRKFYFNHTKTASNGNIPSEVCTVGSRFQLRMFFNNLKEQELGLILLCMGVKDRFNIKVGGGKPVGYGSSLVHVTGISLSDRVKDRYSSWEQTVEVQRGDQITTVLDRLTTAGRQSQLFIGEQFEQLRKILETQASPPNGLY
jgi:CRISPR/Cas system CSM-associated protein Csm3 (group 7 of RAMP superfamily)